MMMRKYITILVLQVTLCACVNAQVGFNNPNPDSTSVLDLTSNTKGLLIPRMTSAERLAIGTPARSLLVFDLTEGKFCFYDGGSWYVLNELSRVAGSNDVNLSPGNLTVDGNITSTGTVSSSSLSVTGFASNALVPTGSIVMWSGSIATIPSGWALCDGTNNTPDLRERFIVGAGSTDNGAVIGTTAYAPGNVGGLNSVTLTAAQSGLVSHNHLITDPGHLHTIAAGRDFAVFINNEANAGSGSSGNEVSGSVHPSNTDAAMSDITINNVPAANALQAHENRPPYFALAFIMKL